MSERNELADKIEVAAPISAGDAESIADAILAAGYRKLEPVWAEGLLNDGEYEYAVTSDCDGSNVKHWKRRPEMVTTQKYTAWEPK